MQKNIKRNILLNPGPATTTLRVKNSLIVTDICPREKEFGELIQTVRQKLLKVVNASDTHTSILFTGSGTAAMEASLTSLISDNDKILIINNGAYGERASQIVKIYKISYIDYKIKCWEFPDIDKVEKLIIANSQITHLFFVHHETTTGMLNPLEDLIGLCKKYNIISIVDAISSYAGIPMDFRKLPIDFLIGSANKCIQGFAGISFVLSNKEYLLKTVSLNHRNLYLNLYQNYLCLEEKGESLFTPAVQILYALNEALDEFFEETQEKRYERYCVSYQTLMKGINELRLKCLLPENQHSKLLTALIEPDHPNYNFNNMHDYLIKNNVTIYPGKIIPKTFRIANIGDIDFRDIEYFLSYLKAYFFENKIQVNL